MTADLFIPCFVDQLYPETAQSMVKILKHCGLKLNFNSKQTCCGQPSFNSGYWKESFRLAEKFFRDFSGENPIVAPSASCVGFIKNFYIELSESLEFQQKVFLLKQRLFELTDFLVNILKIEDLGSTFAHRVTYHDSCSALREYGIYEEPRKLLAKVKGLTLVEMPENDVCCGFGGTFSVKNIGISSAMVQQKVENALSTGAEYIVSTEASCLLNIETYIKQQKLPIKAIHIADLLANGLKNG